MVRPGPEHRSRNVDGRHPPSTATGRAQRRGSVHPTRSVSYIMLRFRFRVMPAAVRAGKIDQGRTGGTIELLTQFVTLTILPRRARASNILSYSWFHSNLMTMGELCCGTRISTAAAREKRHCDGSLVGGLAVSRGAVVTERCRMLTPEASSTKLWWSGAGQLFSHCLPACKPQRMPVVRMSACSSQLDSME